MSMRNNIASLLAGALFCGLLVGLYLSLSGGYQPPTAADTSKQRFINLRHGDSTVSDVRSDTPARVRARPSFETSLKERPPQAVDPLQAFASGDEMWEDTALTLNDLFWLRDQRLQCAQDYALELSVACRAEYAIVVSPGDTPGLGTIVEGEVTTSEFNVPMTDVDQAACAAYATCLLEARIGSSIPIPAEERGPITILQPIVYEWASASLFDPSQVAELIGSYEDTMASAPEMPVGEEKRYYRSAQDTLDYLYFHLSVLTAD